MTVPQSSLLTTILGLAAMFLSLSLLVQVIQELYKYLRSSKARAYQNSLIDYLGPLAHMLMRTSSLPDVRVRGPMQLIRIRPSGMVLPLKRESLVDALERTAPSWVQRAIRHLTLETELQSGKSALPSQNWKAFLRELSAAEQGTAGYWSAYAIAGFLREWDHVWDPDNRPDTKPGEGPIPTLGVVQVPTTLDASAILKAFRTRFLSEVEHASRNFNQFETNFEYTYRRLNTRLTFVISLVIALFGNLSIESLWDHAARMDPDVAVAFAEKTLELSQESTRIASTGDSLAIEQLKVATQLVQQLPQDSSMVSGARWFDQVTTLKAVARIWTPNVWSGLRYVLGCLLTAIVVTFGAPFWNDIASALLRLQRGTGATLPTKESGNG